MICNRCGQTREEKFKQTYVESILIRDRAVTLENITTQECRCGIIPVYTKIGYLLLLAQRYPTANRFRWDEGQSVWRVIPNAANSKSL